MVTVHWCLKQKKGIKLIEPNENLSKEYLATAEETLNELRGEESNIWKATKKYYFKYFILYSFLIKAGIKCEIHDCTLEICKLIEKEGILPKGTAESVEKDKELRIDNQYYLKNIEINIDFTELSDFYLEMKNTINMLDEEIIGKIRKLIAHH